MRIAIAYDSLFPWSKGGGERQYRRFAEEFAAAGHEVTYLTRRHWGDETPTIDGVRIVAVSTDHELYDANGVRKLGPALRYARGLFAHLRGHRDDYEAVLVSALPTTNVLAVRAALTGTRVVVAVDWLEVWPPEQWREYSGPVIGRVASLLQHAAARLSPIATCHSQLSARRLRAAGLRTEPMVSPGLIDEVPTGVEPRLAGESAPNAIFVGRHIADKRVESIPAAILEARRTLPDLTATIFGDGPTRTAVRAEIDRLGLADVVRLPGFVSQEELDEGIRSAACLVNPSAREGYGLVVVEACAAGTPVVLVAGESNASVELVEDGVNGRVAASTSAADLGAAIVEVVSAGDPLRKSTHAWFTEATATKTIRVTAERIRGRLEEVVQRRTAVHLR